MSRRHGVSGRMRRAAVVAACMASLMACADGYPTEDVAQTDPARMTQAQLLAALNGLGKAPHLGRRWRYDLHADCELEISARQGDKDRRRVVLEGAQVSTRTADGVSEIRLLPSTGGDRQAVVVLETRNWSDTVTVRSLLTHLEARCGNPAGSAT